MISQNPGPRLISVLLMEREVGVTAPSHRLRLGNRCLTFRAL